MKILFVIPRMNGGGAERVIANLANCLCNNNNVRIVSIVSNESFYKLDEKIEFCSESLNINRKNFITTIYCYMKYFFKSLNFIKKNIKEYSPDCIISFLIETDILTYLASKRNKNVVRVFSERNDPTKRTKIKKIILKKIYKNSDLFVCQSKKVYEYYSFIQNDKKVIIPNPLNDALPDAIFEEKNHNIVSVGRLFPQKNFEVLINSYIDAVNDLPNDCNLLIYGDGPLKEKLESIINSNNMNDRIKLMGSSKDVLNEIKDSAMFVMSSDYEGFPNALIEAMAVGLPVVSTDFYTGVASELISEENGQVVPINNKEALKNAIIQIMNNKEKRDNIRRQNIKVREKFKSSKISRIWIDNIEKANERKRQ